VTPEEQAYVALLERVVQEQWGVLLLADLVVDDPKVKAAFHRVDKLCKKTGLHAREGMRFIETKQES
jgi:hypothetical protein